MKLNVQTDNLFLIGKSHKVCQDYTLTGEFDDMHYAIVCDGCSSSKDTDIGARILAMAAKQFIDLIPKMTYQSFGSLVIRRANDIRTGFGLHISCLDATLMVAFTSKSVSNCYCYGDGYIIDKQGSDIFLHEHKFESGAPYYLSYWLDKNRAAAYNDMFGKEPLVLTKWMNGEEVSCSHHSFEFPLELESDIVPGALILATDGLDTFNGSNGPYLKALDVHRAFIDFKGTAGEFLKRRAVKHCEYLEKEHKVFHQDDLGLACLLFKEEEI